MENQELKALEDAGPRIREITRLDPASPVFFELLSGAVIWKDEQPSKIKDIWALRVIWHYRTGLLLGEPPAKYEPLWRRARELFPEWVGFHPSRSEPSPELMELVRRLKKSGDRELEKCERFLR